MTTKIELKHREHPKSKERIFFLCEDCLWSMTLLDKSHIEEIIGYDNKCPMCWQDDLSSFPLVLDESYTHDYSERRGIDVKFGVQK